MSGGARLGLAAAPAEGASGHAQTDWRVANPPRGCEFEEDGEDVEDFLRQCGYCPWWERPAAPDTLQKDRDLLVELQQALRPINVVHGWNFWVPKVSTCDRRAGRSGGLTQKRSTAGPVRQRGRSPA